MEIKVDISLNVPDNISTFSDMPTGILKRNTYLNFERDLQMSTSNVAKKTELLSKISTKGVYGAVNIKELHEGKEPVAIMRVIGIASGMKTGESNFGPFVAFTGDFKAINLKTGAEYRSGKLFLPNIASNLIEGALANTDTDSVQFAFDVSVKPVQDRQGKDSYEYGVVPLVEAGDNDPLAALEKSLSAPALEDHSKDKGGKAK